MVQLDELPTQDEHPIATELASLKAAVTQFQDEAHSSSLKLQRHTLGSARIHEQLAQLERENSLLKAELTVLRANPRPESSHQSSSHPAVLQVQQLTLSLRTLSDKFILTEEALLECTNELANARNEVTKAKHASDGAYELAAKVRGREEEGKHRERELEWKLKEAEEKVKMSDLVLKEYADLVRSLEGRPSLRSPTSATFPRSPSVKSDNGSPSFSLDAPSTSSSVTLTECLAGGRIELEKLVSEFRDQTERLQAELTQARDELSTLRALYEAERKAAESDRVELNRVKHELQKLQLDDNTAAKMVSRYMKFSQNSTDMLQHAMQTLKTRHEATVDTLSSQMVSLSEQLRESEAMTDRLRSSLDELGGDLMKESYGRRHEARLRIRLVNREEQIQEGLKRWIRGSEEALRRVEGDERVHEPLLSMVQDAKILLESLDGPVTDTSFLSGSLARMLAMQSAVDGLMEELREETARRVELEKLMPVVGANGTGTAAELTPNIFAGNGLAERNMDTVNQHLSNGSAHTSQQNGAEVKGDGPYSPPPPPPVKDFPQSPSTSLHRRGKEPLSGSQGSPLLQTKPSISLDEVQSPVDAVPVPSSIPLVVRCEPQGEETIFTNIVMIPAAPSEGSTSPVKSPATADALPPPETLSSAPIDNIPPSACDYGESTNNITSDSQDLIHSESLDEAPPSAAVQADNVSHVGNSTVPSIPETFTPSTTLVEVEDVNSSDDSSIAGGVGPGSYGREERIDEEPSVDSLSSQPAQETGTDVPTAENLNVQKDHSDDIPSFIPTSLHPSAANDVPDHLVQSAIPDSILAGNTSTQPSIISESTTYEPVLPRLGNPESESQSFSRVRTDSVAMDVYRPSPKPACEFKEIAKDLEEFVASHEFESTAPAQSPADSSTSSKSSATNSLAAEDTSTPDVQGSTSTTTTHELPSSAVTSQDAPTVSVQDMDSLAPKAELAVPKPPLHPLLDELAQVGHRYDDLQRAFRDCHMALEALKKSIVSSTAATRSPSVLFQPSRTIGGIPSEILTAVLDRLTDYTEDARVELEIKTSDEALLAKGYETLLSVPGALSSNSEPGREGEEAGPSRSDVEIEVRAFVDGTELTIQKAYAGFKLKLDNLQNDIAAIKKAIHSLDAEDTIPASGALSLTKSEGGGGWASWIRGPPSRPSSPAPGSAASATFGNIMTSPRLRQPPSLNFKNPKRSAANNDPVARLGLRVPMPSFALHTPSSPNPSTPPRSRTVSTMYMLGLGALRSPSGTISSPSAAQRTVSTAGSSSLGVEPETSDSETDNENSDIE